MNKNDPVREALADELESWHCCANSTQELMNRAAAALRTPAPLHSEPVAWRSPEVTPPVKRGQQMEFIVAVYRASSEKVYTFASSYLNAHRLQYEECQKDPTKQGFCDECEDGCPTTGWFCLTGDGDNESGCYQSLSLRDGDRLVGWQEMPQWTSPPAIELDGGVRMQRIIDAEELPDQLTPPAIDELFNRDDLFTARAVFARLKNFRYKLVRSDETALAVPKPGRAALQRARAHIQAALGLTEENRLALAVQGRRLVREIDAILISPVALHDGEIKNDK